MAGHHDGTEARIGRQATFVACKPCRRCEAMPDPRGPALYDDERAAGDLGKRGSGSAGVMGKETAMENPPAN